MKKHLLLLSCLLFLFGSTLWASIYAEKQYIKLIEAKSQRSTSGIRGGINSTEYYFKLKILTSEKIEFDSIWLGNKVFKPYISNNKPVITSQPPSFNKNDIITLRVSQLEVNNSKTTMPPFKYNGDALLRYKVNGSHKYLIINKIKSIPEINHP